YHAVNEFCIVDLSAFYLDVLKDRLYTFAPKGIERRSAQTVLWRITEALVRLVAPILTFTSDEVWQYLPAMSDRPASVHLALFPNADKLGSADEELLRNWSELLAFRNEVLQRLEGLRKEGQIGKGLGARLDISAAGRLYNTMKTVGPELKEVFNVSQVLLTQMSGDTGLAFTVAPAAGTRCARCWNYYPDDSPLHVRQVSPTTPAADAPWSVCGRCENALAKMGYLPEVHPNAS
ncbi:MAG: class I tRNA ligase family protein, partial [Acidobacteriota bacterium]